MTDINANLNSTECLVEMTNFGETIVHNICNGTVKHIPWGTMDYVAISFVYLFGFAVIAIMLSFAYMVIKDY